MGYVSMFNNTALYHPPTPLPLDTNILLGVFFFSYLFLHLADCWVLICERDPLWGFSPTPPPSPLEKQASAL